MKTNYAPNTGKAIKHVSKYLSTFLTSTPSGPSLSGAQQIPGKDPSLRAATISFPSNRYARAEIVKVSSALAKSYTTI